MYDSSLKYSHAKWLFHSYLSCLACSIYRSIKCLVKLPKICQLSKVPEVLAVKILHPRETEPKSELKLEAKKDHDM